MPSKSAALILGLSIVLGGTALGGLLGHSALRFKEYERTVTVKGLSEREMPADIVLWPIQLTAAENDLSKLYEKLEGDTARIMAFLSAHAIEPDEITVSPPQVTDKLAQQYGGNESVPFRYTALQTVSIYSTQVDTVREALAELADLGKEGIVFAGSQGHGGDAQYLFTGLNDIKPGMVEEATRNARSVAEKFAKDSESRLGKIKRASQGQFSISSRDSHAQHLKKIRVVSTIEYYLSD